MAILEIQRTQQKQFTGDVYESQELFQLPAPKLFLKVSLRIHPVDYVTAGLSIRLRVMAFIDREWEERAWMEWLSPGPAGKTNKHGVNNPNPFIRFSCGDLNNRDLRVDVRSNGARLRVVVGGMTGADWDDDDDQGEDE